MPWLLSTTLIRQLNGVQDQEGLFPPLGWGSWTLEGHSFLRQACDLLSQTTNHSFVDYYLYYSPNQYQGVRGEHRRRDKSADSAVTNNNFV